MKRHLTWVLALVAIIAITATPAQAAYSQCPAGVVCIFDNDNGLGPWWGYSGTSGGGVCINVGAAANDRAESYKNNHAKAVSFYWNANCGSSNHAPWGPRAAGTSGNFPNFGPPPIWASANQTSSFFIHTGSA